MLPVELSHLSASSVMKLRRIMAYCHCNINKLLQVLQETIAAKATITNFRKYDVLLKDETTIQLHYPNRGIKSFVEFVQRDFGEDCEFAECNSR